MDSITIKNKLYEKSSLVAKRYGYTVDYLGQLARSGKIDSKLVGRSRYVHAPSVDEYQKLLSDQSTDNHGSNKVETKKKFTSHSHTDNRTSRPDADTYKVPLHIVRDTTNHSKTSHSLATYFTEEDPELIPVIKKQPTSTDMSNDEYGKHTSHVSTAIQVTSDVDRGSESVARIPVNKDLDSNDTIVNVKNTTESKDFKSDKKLKIHSYSANFSIINPQLPKIRLRGKLKVSSGAEKDISEHSETKEVRSIQNYFDDTDKNFSRRIGNSKKTSSDEVNSSIETLHKKPVTNIKNSTAVTDSSSIVYSPQSVRGSSKNGSNQTNNYLLVFSFLFLFIILSLVFLESRTVFLGEQGLTATTWHFVLPW